jgi:hypothetical protein
MIESSRVGTSPNRFTIARTAVWFYGVSRVKIRYMIVLEIEERCGLADRRIGISLHEVTVVVVRVDDALLGGSIDYYGFNLCSASCNSWDTSG